MKSEEYKTACAVELLLASQQAMAAFCNAMQQMARGRLVKLKQ